MEARKCALCLDLIRAQLWPSECDELLLAADCGKFAVLLNKYMHLNAVNPAKLVTHLARNYPNPEEERDKLSRVISAWRNSDNSPSKRKCGDVMACAQLLELTGEAHSEFLMAARCPPFPDKGFVQELFKKLRQETPHIRLLLVTEDRLQGPVLETIIKQAKQQYAPPRKNSILATTFHVVLPAGQGAFFQNLAEQCQFDNIK